MFKTLTFAFLMAGVAAAADLTGIWTGVMTDRNGDLQDVSVRLFQTGGQLTGKMYGDNESIPITDGKLDGDTVSFIVTTELNGSISRMLYTGKLDGDVIHVTRARADAPPKSTPDKPSSGKAAPEKPNQKQTFVLKRL